MRTPQPFTDPSTKIVPRLTASRCHPELLALLFRCRFRSPPFRDAALLRLRSNAIPILTDRVHKRRVPVGVNLPAGRISADKYLVISLQIIEPFSVRPRAHALGYNEVFRNTGFWFFLCFLSLRT